MNIKNAVGKIRFLLSRNEWLIRLLNLQREERSIQPTGAAQENQADGLVMIQIDGLGRDQFESALAKGEMPFLKKILSRKQYICRTLYSGLPSSTPAVQGELFYGVQGVVPSFGFRHSANGQLQRMYDPTVASDVQHELEQSGTPLLTGGSAYCNIYTGGANESHFCAASMGWKDILRGIKARNWILIALLNIPTIIRIVGLMVIELVFAIIDVFRGILTGKSLIAEIKFMAARVAVSIFLRDLITIGASVDISRGLPIIHVNYFGYDEQSHRRGPQSTFAHWALKGIDRSIEKLSKAANKNSNKHYDFWIYSDHGQEQTTPYEKLTGHSIDAAVQLAAAKGSTNSKPAHVVAMGPVGHIYFEGSSNSNELMAIAQSLVHDHQVPAAVQVLDNQLFVHTREVVLKLPGQEVEAFGQDHPFLSVITADLLRLCNHVDSGDLVLLGCIDGTPALSFAVENGAHAGTGPNETKAFVITPKGDAIEECSDGFIRPKAMHKAALKKREKSKTDSLVKSVDQSLLDKERLIA